MLELVALGSDETAGEAVAAEVGGIAYVANEATHPKAPFRSLVRAVVSDADRLAAAADVALHLAFSRQVKRHEVSWAAGSPTPGVVGAFCLRGHPDRSHADVDAHWRDVHAPLALQHHAAMWDYVQLAVVRTLDGPTLDGIALCGFPSRADYRDRFYDDADGERIITADLARFADLSRSPRPAVLTEILPARWPPRRASRQSSSEV